MTPDEQYDFSLFKPRNYHGKKNRNVILTLLVIWATAVFGFQVLLRIIEKPVPEKALTAFESAWPVPPGMTPDNHRYQALLRSFVMVRGKNTVKADHQKILSAAISTVLFNLLPDDARPEVLTGIARMEDIISSLALSKGQEYLDLRASLDNEKKTILSLTGEYTGFEEKSLESSILINSLTRDFPESPGDPSFSSLPEIMKLYLTHNRSALTDATFLGFPFHYFYTAVFLLILFIALCILYNILVERRLRKEGIVE
jgi:putative solute:sodium symporter small subunit